MSDNKEIIAFKGFDKEMKCREFQYEVGKTYYHEGEVSPCNSGFHACEYPLSVLNYYSPSTSRFAVVKQGGEIKKDNDKTSSAKITIEAEINLSQLIDHAVAYVVERAKLLKPNHNKKDNISASNSGIQGAASNSGIKGAASNSGIQGAASNSGHHGAASNSGHHGAAINSGYQGVASNSGIQGAAINSGYQGVAKSSMGGAIFLVERNDDYEIINVFAGIAGKDGIKPDQYYVLIDGELTECD